MRVKRGKNAILSYEDKLWHTETMKIEFDDSDIVQVNKIFNIYGSAFRSAFTAFNRHGFELVNPNNLKLTDSIVRHITNRFPSLSTYY